MRTHTDVILGFDPGGRGHFGWSICSDVGEGLQLHQTGLADDAWNVITQVRTNLMRLDVPNPLIVRAAGIDAPLFWSKRGARELDTEIRRALKGTKARVLAVNSLYGGVQVQGILVGKHLREEWEGIQITESHPKALLQLLNNPEQCQIFEMANRLINYRQSEHERDAILSAVTAWAMIHKPHGWQNLYERENCPIEPFEFDTPVGYWMPIP